MIKSEYGLVKNEDVINHFQRMIGKSFKIIHLKEEDCQTIDVYIKSLSRKFMGISRVYHREEALMIIDILNGINISDHETLRSDVFEVIKIIEMIKEDLM